MSSTSVTRMTLCGAFINVITEKLNMITRNIRYDCDPLPDHDFNV
jgi:hypothetical protein